MRRQLKDGSVIYSSRFIGYFFILLSLWILGSMLMTFLFLDPFAWLFMGVPGLGLGVLVLVNGIGAIGTRFELSQDRLRIAAPSWRATLMLPIQRIDVPWKAVQAVQYRKEFYRVPILLGVGVFRIQTESQPIIYGSTTLRQIVQAMEEIAERADTTIRAESDVSAGLIKTFLHGPPEWNDVTDDDASNSG
jgi:hypothetical protein